MKGLNILMALFLVHCMLSNVSAAVPGAAEEESAAEPPPAEQTGKHYIDPVCKREVRGDTPYMKKVDGEVYYFCSAACKRGFKKEMVVPPPVKKVYVDPVCGCRVSEDTPCVADYKGATYHFCVNSCKNRFLASPGEFSCFCAEGEHCPHREGRVGIKPCKQGRIPGWGRWTRWGCPVHMKKSDFNY